MGLLQLWRVLDLQPRHSHLKSSVAIGSFGSGLGWTGFPGTLASFGTGIAKSVSCARLRKLERTLAPHGQTIPGALYVSSHNPPRRFGPAGRFSVARRSIEPRSAVASPCACDALLWSVVGAMYSFGRRWFRWGMLLCQDELCIQLSQLTVDGGSLLRRA